MSEDNLLLECPDCNINFSVEPIARYSTKEDDPFDSTLYSFCKCPNCEKPLLCEQDFYPSDDFSSVLSTAPKLLFPNSRFHLNPIIPELLRTSLGECIKCYKAKSYTATSIMCRRTIEGFCKVKGVQEKNLSESIKKLNELGIINDQLYEWANHLRIAGNKAAHDIESTFSAADAKDILDFTIAILDFTFSFKDKFEKFKERFESQ